MLKDADGNFLHTYSLDHVIETKDDSEVTFGQTIPNDSNFGCSTYYDSPYDILSYKQLYKAIYRSLSPVSKIVFKLKINPPYGLFKMMLEENAQRKKKRASGLYVKQMGGITSELISKYTTDPATGKPILSICDIKICINQIKNATRLVLAN